MISLKEKNEKTNTIKKRNLRFLEGFILCSVAVKLAPPIDKSCSKSVPFNELCSY